MLKSKLENICRLAVKGYLNKQDLIDTGALETIILLSTFSEDKYIQFLSLKILAELCKNSSSITKLISNVLDIQSISEKVFSNEEIKTKVLDNLPFYRILYNNAINNTESSKYIDELLLFTFTDLISRLAKIESTHQVLIESNTLPFFDRLLRSNDLITKEFAFYYLSGLSKSVEGRKLIAKTDIFYDLYEILYFESFPNSIPFFKKELIYYAKGCIQRLILSKSAMEILTERDPDLPNRLSNHPKSDLPIATHSRGELQMVQIREMAEKFLIGSGLSAVLTTIRHGFSLLTKDLFRAKRKVSLKHKISDSISGTVALVGFVISLNIVNRKFLTLNRDDRIHFHAQIALTSLVSSFFLSYVLCNYRHVLIPAIIGVSLNELSDLYYDLSKGNVKINDIIKF